MQKKVLALLRAAGDGYISGEEIASCLGVSRTAVWKHIRALKAAGYAIESHARKGYSLLDVPDLLLPQELQPMLRTEVIGKNMLHFDDIPSSNNEAKRLAAEGAPDGTVVVAEAQGAGKGRLSRGWFSPAKKGIWFSVVLRPSFLPQEAPKCTLMAAVAVVRAMRDMGFSVGIKWPNDVLDEKGRKLVGILTEMSAEMERVNFVVIGTGINVNLWPEDFPEDVKDIATSLAMLRGCKVDRVELFARVLEAMDELYMRIGHDGFGAVLDEWRHYSVTLGQEVNVIGVKETFSGTAADIDDDGALLVDTRSGRRRVLAGDVSIRPRVK
ncbi:MAG: biotin--[Schwartzia sp.]|nr:biotin--[acetyl-CoA-carboxylase] ligase [Schwartzia sp. (in: firmicutes)]MBR1885120.1 biotin--[acetyl-CoA-carboxylase] ligase [Schwartzia sp. (in: firmicutes)]